MYTAFERQLKTYIFFGSNEHIPGVSAIQELFTNVAFTYSLKCYLAGYRILSCLFVRSMLF